MIKLITIILTLCLCSGTQVGAQTFSFGELSLIKTQQVIVENYTPIIIATASVEPMLNKFDTGNPYTYLQVVKDMKANNYHILFQTSFMGKLLFVAYSNNLNSVFNCVDKPMFLFSRCMKQAQQNILSVQIADAALKCILARLNYCSD